MSNVQTATRESNLPEQVLQAVVHSLRRMMTSIRIVQRRNIAVLMPGFHCANVRQVKAMRPNNGQEDIFSIFT